MNKTYLRSYLKYINRRATITVSPVNKTQGKRGYKQICFREWIRKLYEKLKHHCAIISLALYVWS